MPPNVLKNYFRLFLQKVLKMLENIENTIPKQLEFILQSCGDEKDIILKIRNRIINFDERIKEFPDTRIIKYGNRKSEPLAEIRLPKPYSKPILILQLPILKNPPYREDEPNQTRRMRIETDNWQEVSRILWVPKDNVAKYKKSYRPNDYVKFKSPSIPSNNELEMLVDIALEKWLENL